MNNNCDKETLEDYLVTLKYFILDKIPRKLPYLIMYDESNIGYVRYLAPICKKLGYTEEPVPDLYELRIRIEDREKYDEIFSWLDERLFKENFRFKLKKTKKRNSILIKKRFLYKLKLLIIGQNMK